MNGYTVTETQEITLLGQNGQPRKVKRVFILTERGTPGSVDIDDANWNPETIKELLAAKAEELDLAFNLG
jgi:hypothetical protein